MSSALLTFNPHRHEYALPDGRLVPSVTTILKAVGVSTDFDAIAAMSQQRGEAIEYARLRGTAVHADCHALDDHDLDLLMVHPDVLPYVLAWATFKENLRLVPTTRERRVYSATLGVCGTLDAICYREGAEDRRILADIKTGDPESAAAQYQTALYQLLWESEHPDEPIAERWSVQLTPDLAIPYRVTRYDDWTDFATARAIVTTYFAQAARRKGSR